MWLPIVAISVGASIGAVLRWFLAMMLNHLHASIQMGTVAANLSGGYMIGLAVAFFANNQHLPAEWRLLIVTGFLGGLTTFSTFSAEVTDLLQKGDFGVAFTTIAIHLLGSLAMTFLGILTYQMFK